MLMPDAAAYLDYYYLHVDDFAAASFDIDA